MQGRRHRPDTRLVPRSRLLVTLLFAFFLASVVAAPAAAEKRSVAPKAQHGRVAVFSLKGVDPATLKRAGVRVGPVRRKLGLRRVRRAARRGFLRIRMSRRTMRRASAASRRRRPRLTLVIGPRQAPPARPSRTATGPLGSFEPGNFSEFSGHSAVAGELATTQAKAYEGSRSAIASYDGSGRNAFARTWFDVDWGRGSDVWYGAAYYIPSKAAMPCYYSLMRWDNYTLYGNPGGDVGGIEVSTSGRARLMRQDYTGDNYAGLTREFDLPEGRWFWLEVHQRLSDRPGEALNEVYLDGSRIDASTTPNGRGKRITEIRHGIVSLGSDGDCAPTAASIFIDRVSVSDAMRGPRP